MTVIAAFVLACGDDDDNGNATAGGGENTSADTASGGKLGLMLDVLRNDNSYGTAVHDGAKRAAEEFGLELSVIDGLTGQNAKARTALTNFARESDYVMDLSVGTFPTLPRVAEQNPDTQFMQIVVPLEGPSNLHYAFPDWYPLGYLAGAVAALNTKTTRSASSAVARSRRP